MVKYTFFVKSQQSQESSNWRVWSPKTKAIQIFINVVIWRKKVYLVEVLLGSTTYIHIANAKTFGSIWLGLCFWGGRTIFLCCWCISASSRFYWIFLGNFNFGSCFDQVFIGCNWRPIFWCFSICFDLFKKCYLGYMFPVR